jgi:hypothetical protein
MYHAAENGAHMSTKMNSPGTPVTDDTKDLSHLAGAQHRLSDAQVKELVEDSKKSFERFDELLAAEKV